jgi:hypothetical protein
MVVMVVNRNLTAIKTTFIVKHRFTDFLTGTPVNKSF